MSMSDPYRGLSSNRRSKKHALDGGVPGVDYTRRRGGKHFAGTPEESDLSGRVAGPPAPHSRDEYDPIRPEYPTAPGYGQPEPWDAIVTGPRMPEPGFDPAPFRPPLIRQDRPLSDRVIIDQAIEEVRTLGGLEERENGSLTADMWLRPRSSNSPDSLYAVAPQAETEPAATSPDRPMDHPEPEIDAQPAQPLVESDALEPPSTIDSRLDGFDMMETAHDAMMGEEASMPDGFATTLDSIVEQLAPEPAMPQPEEPDPYQLMNQAFDQQMQMMDPFNMMGPLG